MHSRFTSGHTTLRAVLPVLLFALRFHVPPAVQAQSPPSLGIGPAVGSNLKLTWPSQFEKSYRVWESPNLSSWSLTSGYPRDGTGVEMEYRFAPGTGSRYYRLTVEDIAPDGFALVPTGYFDMGDPSPTSVGADEELPRHSLYVNGFYMGRYEVTWTLWDTVRRWGETRGYAGLPNGGSKGTGHPVFDVNWYEMVKWCNAYSEMEGLTPCYYLNGEIMRQGAVAPEYRRNADGYRLPSEAEWEKAARGSVSGDNFPWGNTISHANANFNSYGSFVYDLTPAPRGLHPDYDDGANPHTSPVGSFAPNGYGLYDMAGNLGEYCWDWHSPTFYSVSPGGNPIGPDTGTARIIRGGSWGQSSSYARCSGRYHAGPGARGMDTGFRLARSVSYGIPGFVLMAPGSFAMGDQSSSAIGLPVELPVHTVTTSGYYIAKNEVPGSEWETVRTWGLAHGYTDLPAAGAKFPNHPVHSVSWHDAVKWCNARSEMELLHPCYSVSGQPYRTGSAEPVCHWLNEGYRLPTEAEWERAARGTLIAKNFPWGDTILHRQANYYSSSTLTYDISPTRGFHTSFSTGSTPYTSPLGSFPAGDFAINDMAGNVREWCWDWAGAFYYAESPGTDPRGESAGTHRILRGGAWSTQASECRNSARFSATPDTRTNTNGFRLVRSLVFTG